MSIIKDIKTLRKTRLVRKAIWPYAKLMLKIFFLLLLMAIYILPAVPLKALGKLFSKIGEAFENGGDGLRDLLHETRPGRNIIEGVYTLEKRKLRFARSFRRWNSKVNGVKNG